MHTTSSTLDSVLFCWRATKSILLYRPYPCNYTTSTITAIY